MGLGKTLEMLGIFGIIGVIIVLLLLIGPFLLIWALNQLFSLKIPFNFWNWLAGLILLLLLRGGWGSRSNAKQGGTKQKAL